MTEALDHPAEAAEHLLHHADLYGVVEATGRTGWQGAALFELTLLPLPALARDGYPPERVRLVIMPPGDRIHVYPRSGPGRRFKHRNSEPADLCLQYDRDDPALRWLPEDGLEPLITLVHRHLMFEETWRRTNVWPCEDAPHGDSNELPHRIRTLQMRRERHRWVRPG
ncbi:hypothetical protein [Sphaerisporangium perillae]|uniref:hypothetical protein n=1 Tax=Sphaerisporangium perillae TaxID=2935860 RepID=UPI00200F1F29|nr:hypothetical protein [Sphaerisporangium perillae]